MPRTLSTAALNAAMAQETGEAYLVLLTVSHADLAAPIRASSDGVDTISRGETFTAFPFDITLPEDSETGPPRAQITIDNVSREIVTAVRLISSPADILIEIVLGSAPDTVEVSFEGFEVRNVGWTALTVTADLTVESWIGEPYPHQRFTPAGFPGLFSETA